MHPSGSEEFEASATAWLLDVLPHRGTVTRNGRNAIWFGWPSQRGTTLRPVSKARGRGTARSGRRSAGRGGFRNVSSPYEAETFRAAPSGRSIPGGRWLRVHFERPGVLVLRRPGPGESRGVAVAMFGHTGLGMLMYPK